jgi:hypothetical protein
MSDLRTFEAHFPKQISKELADFVTNEALLHSRYLFYATVLGVQFAYCTHCNKQHRVETKLKHKQEDVALCPHCQSKCRVRAAGMSRKRHEDRAVVVWYEKSVIDPTAITTIIAVVYRNYSGDYKNVETTYNAGHMYLFKPGHSEYWDWYGKRKTTHSVIHQKFSGFDKYISLKNVAEAVKGTAFQYSTWEEYSSYRNSYYLNDMVDFFDLAARYPCIEYLTKLGFGSFVDAKLHGDSTYGAINWRGKTIQSVVRLTKYEINEIKSSGLKYKPIHFRFHQIMKNRKINLSVSESYSVAQIISPYYKEMYERICKYSTELETVKYLLKQLKRYSNETNCLTDWKDYLRECEELGMDLTESRYLFPNNLKQAHAKTTKQVKLKRDEIADRKIAERVKLLNKFTFERNGLIAYPASCLADLFNEGKVLNHCVGGYAQNYANGSTNLFFVRRTSEPNKPYYTLEFNDNQIRQCRGLKNCSMSDEVSAFVSMFIKNVELQSKSKKSKRKKEATAV